MNCIAKSEQRNKVHATVATKSNCRNAAFAFHSDTQQKIKEKAMKLITFKKLDCCCTGEPKMQFSMKGRVKGIWLTTSTHAICMSLAREDQKHFPSCEHGNIKRPQTEKYARRGQKHRHENGSFNTGRSCHPSFDRNKFRYHGECDNEKRRAGPVPLFFCLCLIETAISPQLQMKHFPSVLLKMYGVLAN